jgi:chromosome segregation ATPase
MQAQVGSLNSQKQNLLETIEKQKIEQAGLKSDLTESKDTIARLETDFTQAQKAIGDLSAQLNLVREENVSLKSEEDALKVELAGVKQEKGVLQAKLSSLAELKKAMRELKIKLRTVIQPHAQEKRLAQANTEGNRGFIFKDGMPTRPARVKIEVSPAPVK